MADLAAFAENIWIVDGPIVRDMDVIFTARMAVVKLSDGSLWVNSPINRIEKEKHDKGNFNHGSSERFEAITICMILIYG